MLSEFDGLKAASKHYHDAVFLADAKRLDNAGYHFGFAAECAVKGMLIRDAGLGQHYPAYWDHFPKLTASARSYLAGRRSMKLSAILNAPGATPFGDWDTGMRYQPAGAVRAEQVAKWQQLADQIIGSTL